MSEPEPADVLVIGAGASGSVMVARLAEAGVSVTCLEQGGWVSPSEFPGEDPAFDAIQLARWAMNPNTRKRPADYPINTAEADIWPLMFNGVGGGTIHYAAMWPRLTPSDFRVRSLDGVADDWPISYEDLAPYYERTQQRWGVSGLAGDPAYPPMPDFPMPALPIGRLGRRAAEGMNALGWHWWPHPNAIASRAHGRLVPCERRGVCQTGCIAGAKASTDITHWPDAIRDGARLITGARVREITVDAAGKATGAIYVDRDGVEHHARGRTVVMATNGIGTPRLLLLSRSAHHPDGLANSSGLVGRRLMLHPMVAVAGTYEDDLESWRGPGGSPVIGLEFYETDHARGFPRGAKWDVYPVAGTLPHFQLLHGQPLAERFGPAAHERMARMMGRTFIWEAQIDDLPQVSNRVELDPELTDSDGIPAPRVIYKVHEDARRNMAFQLDRMREAHEAGGAIETNEWHWMPEVGWHTLGTARCGTDPSDSVVDAYGRSHDVDNLFIIDGSVFVTGSAMNPTSTIAAFALRTADHILATRRNA
jgi:choline dehydrogenase-like flavoprotein